MKTANQIHWARVKFQTKIFFVSSGQKEGKNDKDRISIKGLVIVSLFNNSPLKHISIVRQSKFSRILGPEGNKRNIEFSLVLSTYVRLISEPISIAKG